MQVALTGVSGFIGAAIARHLREAGHAVTGLVRPTSRRDHIEAWVDRFVVGGQDDTACWDDLLDGADCVVHNSFDWSVFKPTLDFERHLESNLMASIRLLHAAAPRQFIYMSSIAVHHDMRPRWQGMIDEDHPLRPGNLYGAAKASVEAQLWSSFYSTGQHTCALRPCGVYGIDPDLPRTIGHPIIQKIKSGKPFRRSGGGKFVHVDDVAAATVAAVGNPDAAGQAYNLVDCYARWADWAALAAKQLGVEADIDFSSPDQPANQFSKAAAQSLGVELNRGHRGIEAHLAELLAGSDVAT